MSENQAKSTPVFSADAEHAVEIGNSANTGQRSTKRAFEAFELLIHKALGDSETPLLERLSATFRTAISATFKRQAPAQEQVVGVASSVPSGSNRRARARALKQAATPADLLAASQKSQSLGAFSAEKLSS